MFSGIEVVALRILTARKNNEWAITINRVSRVTAHSTASVA